MGCRGLPLVAVATSVLVFGRVSGAEHPTDGSDVGDEVTVIARRIAEDPQKIPVAVTALSGAKLDSLAINSVLDLNKVPGLTDVPIGSRTNASFSIRGQGTAYGGQPGVIAYLGEVPNFPLAYFDLLSVQVIKGPQGTLFGQTTTGGVVLFEPERPANRFGGYLDVQAGNDAYIRVRGALNMPIIDGKLLARVAGELRKRNGWSTGVDSQDALSSTALNNIDDSHLRASVTWRPVEGVELYGLYAQDDQKTHGASSVLYYFDPRFMNPSVRNLIPASVPSIAAGWQFWTGYAPPPGQTFSQLLATAFDQQLAAGPLTTQTNFSQRNEMVSRGAITQLSWDIGAGVKVRSISGLHWQTYRGAKYDLDGSNLPLDDDQCRYVTGTISANGTCAETGGWPTRTLTQELQIQGSHFSRRLQWQVGGFYLQDGTRQFTENTLPIVLFGSLNADPASKAFCASINVTWPCAQLARTDISSKAVFGQATWGIDDRVHLTGGYRETWDYTRTDTTGKATYQVPFEGQLVTVPVYGGTPAVGADTNSTTVNLPANESYNVSADWQIDETTLLYLAHRSGYKTGGINAAANPGTPQRTYGPERANDLEMGIKTEWSAGDLHATLNADVYHTWYAHIQEGQIIPGMASTVTSNAAGARITGFEIEGAIEPTTWLRIATNIAYTDARYTHWLEYSTCAAQYWRPQCSGLAANTVISVDHAAGQISLPGVSIDFAPDRFLNTSRWQWSLQPMLLLRPWLGQDVSVSANIYHRGPYVDSTATANSSITAGVSLIQRNTVFGYSTANPFDAPGYTLADLRVDWRHVRNSHLSLAAAVTNIADRVYRVSSASAFQIIGDVYSVVGEPRMWFAQATYEF